MTDTGPPRRRPRADARRNYERLLTEADAVFREQGAEASLEGIARRAGVAIGTLYGHFPSRRALIGALLRDRHEALFAYGDGLVTDTPAGPALAAWARAVVAHAALYRGLAALIAAGLDDETSELHTACARMNGIGEQLVSRAQESGALRATATGADVFTLISAAAWTREHLSPAQADRLLDLTLTGLGLEAGDGQPS